MRKKSILTMMFAFSLVLSTFAVKVNKDKAILLARNFYFERAGQFKDIDYSSIKVTGVVEETGGNMLLYYAININQGGFVLVSAEDGVLPVLGYAFEGEYTGQNKPCNFSAWMEQYTKAIMAGSKSANITPEVVTIEWERLTSGDISKLRHLKGQKGVQPLIMSNWDQDKYYNAQCPQDLQGPDGHAYAGCVATAMGQIMYYYRWPEHGTGSYSYQHPEYGTISADFESTTYDWDNMQNSLETYNDGVAELLFHLGVSVDMDYGPNGSGMWNHHAALALGTYFNYLPSTQYVWRDTTNLDWDSLVIAHLDRGQVLYYAGWSDLQYISGHAFVCDGYQDTGYCHFNWGWSGLYNGYFYLNNLNPGGSNFNLVQELIINIYPDTLQFTYPNYCQGGKTLHYLNGTLEDGSGPIGDYLPGQNCQWLLEPQYLADDSVSNITVTFQNFDTEENQDILTIYDGDNTNSTVLGSFSGDNLPPELTSTGNKILITFTSNNSVNRKGWSLSYKSNLPEYCSTNLLTDPTGSITDGSGSKHYLDNTLCTWSIQPLNAAGLSLTFTEFSTESIKDYVQVFDMNTSVSLGKFSGSQIPPSVTSPSGAMYIVFKTNGSVNASGWAANYSVTNVGVQENTETPDITLFPNPADTWLNISIEGGIDKDIHWQITDNCGRNLKTGEYPGNTPVTINLDISHFSPGCYQLKVTTDKGVFIKKIIII